MNPKNDILVIPTWGCGPPWKNKPRDIATIFAFAIRGEVQGRTSEEPGSNIRMGRCYREIHFVFNPMKSTVDRNSPEMPSTSTTMTRGQTVAEEHPYKIFSRVFRDKYKIQFQDMKVDTLRKQMRHSDSV